MNENKLITYYNKFNEDKRLTTKHGMIEYLTAMKYINHYLKKMNNPKIIDVGAGTGKYSIALAEQGYDVTAVELIKHNLRVLEAKNSNVKAYQGNATNLSRFKDNSFDMVLLFGPLYHLISEEEKIKSLTEAKRIVKKDGLILISYCMNEYAVLTYGFIEGNINNCKKENLIDKNYHITPKDNDLYSFSRLEDINKYKKTINLKRIKIIAQDGPTEYLKKTINKMNDEEYKEFINYHLKTCEKRELLGASRHILDILKKQ